MASSSCQDVDHADTQNVEIYIEARPDIVKRIDKAIAMQMAPWPRLSPARSYSA